MALLSIFFFPHFSEFLTNPIHYPKIKLKTQSKTSLPCLLSLALLSQDEVGYGKDEGEDEGNPGQDVAVPVAAHGFVDMEFGGVDGGCYHDAQACRTGEVTMSGKDVNMKSNHVESACHMIGQCFYNKYIKLSLQLQCRVELWCVYREFQRFLLLSS